MKLQIVSSEDGNISYILFEEGYYKIDWTNEFFCFFHYKIHPRITFEKPYLHSKVFCLNSRKRLTSILDETAKKTTCCTLLTQHYIFMLEYVEGNILLHSNTDRVDEIYLSAEEPFNYKGEFCKTGKENQSFRNRKTLVLKRTLRNT